MSYRYPTWIPCMESWQVPSLGFDPRLKSQLSMLHPGWTQASKTTRAAAQAYFDLKNSSYQHRSMKHQAFLCNSFNTRYGHKCDFRICEMVLSSKNLLQSGLEGTGPHWTTTWKNIQSPHYVSRCVQIPILNHYSETTQSSLARLFSDSPM